MLREERIRSILSAVTASGTASLRDLADLCQASEMTIRRDLAELESQGRIRRVRGGASSVRSEDPGYWQRVKQSSTEKRALADMAASLVRDQQTVFLDAGTTIAEVARALVRRCSAENLNIRVVTHAVNISAELAECPRIAVRQLGGEVDRGTLSAVGYSTISQIRDMNFDVFFMGTSGLNLEAGCTNSAPLGVEIKRAANAQSNVTWLVADGSKWGEVCTYKVFEIEALTGWITDAQVTAVDKKTLAANGVELRQLHTQLQER